jgi:hypothetical protein
MNMEAVGAGITRAVATTVIDAVTMEIITLTDFNPNALTIVNNRLQHLISINPRIFISNFNGISNGHPFYLQDGVLLISFGSGEWLVGDRGIRNVPLSLAQIQNVTVSSDMFHVLPAERYDTIMVRLSDVAPSFGYTISPWNAVTRTVEISRNDVLVSSVTVGRNLYSYSDSEPRALELAPEIIRSRVYVPLSYFREILGIATHVVDPGTPDGYIFMSRFEASSVFEQPLE